MNDEYREKLEKYVHSLEKNGVIVHLPHRDTDQTATGLEICKQNANAIKKADEVHIFYSSKSLGTHFDMGVAFSLNKKLVIVEGEPFDEGKSFARMITEWEREFIRTQSTWSRIKCFFGFHSWSEPENVDYELTRVCEKCGRLERMYMGHWVPFPRKNKIQTNGKSRRT